MAYLGEAPNPTLRGLAKKDSFTKNDPCAAYVKDTESYKFSSDAWHYDTDGFIKMGTAFVKPI